MLTIRMCRVGAKKKPFYRVVVTEARTAPDGAALEVLGYYHPAAQPETMVVDRTRLQHWVELGAQMSDTVRTLVARHPPPPVEVAEPAEAAEQSAPEAEAAAAASDPAPPEGEAEAPDAADVATAPDVAEAEAAPAAADAEAAPAADDAEAQTS